MLLAWVPAARGARPFVTDDARIAPARGCQLETWGQVGPDGDQVWALPACNPFGHVEFTLGAAFLPDVDHHGPAHPALLAQVKALFRELPPDGIGFGLAGGSLIDAKPLPAPEAQLGNLYLYAPVSVSASRLRLVLHGNLGVRHERHDDLTRATWGLGSEWAPLRRVEAIAEVYGDSRASPHVQVGGRFWVVPDHVQLDFVLGREFSGAAGDWVSVGLRLISSPFL